MPILISYLSVPRFVVYVADLRDIRRQGSIATVLSGSDVMTKATADADAAFEQRVGEWTEREPGDLETWRMCHGVGGNVFSRVMDAGGTRTLEVGVADLLARNAGFDPSWAAALDLTALPAARVVLTTSGGKEVNLPAAEWSELLHRFQGYIFGAAGAAFNDSEQRRVSQSRRAEPLPADPYFRRAVEGNALLREQSALLREEFRELPAGFFHRQLCETLAYLRLYPTFNSQAIAEMRVRAGRPVDRGNWRAIADDLSGLDTLSPAARRDWQAYLDSEARVQEEERRLAAPDAALVRRATGA